MGAFSIPGLSDAVGPVPAITPFPAVDSVTICGLVLPGRWTLSSADKEFGYQIQEGNFLTGATVLPKGDPLVVAKFKGVLWQADQVQAFKTIRSSYLTRPVFGTGPFTAALGVDHPELKALGVKSVVVQRITPLIDEGGGYWTCELTLLQYRKPRPAMAAPKQEIPGVTSPTPKPKDQLDRDIQGAQGQRDALMGQFLE